MSKVAEQILDMVGNPDHCGIDMDLKCAHIDTTHGPHGLKVGLVCTECGAFEQKIVNVEYTAEMRELLGGDEYWNDDVSYANPFAVAEPPTVEEVAGADGTYFCSKCGHNHREDSQIGADHIEHAVKE